MTIAIDAAIDIALGFSKIPALLPWNTYSFIDIDLSKNFINKDTDEEINIKIT